MKYKVLLSGRNTGLIDNFFLHLFDRFECVTTSERKIDIQNHLQVFKPNLFLCCLKNEPVEMHNIYGSVAKDVASLGIKFCVIGSEQDRGNFRHDCVLVPDIMMDITVPLPQVADEINRFLENKNKRGMVYIPGPEEKKRELAQKDIHDIMGSSKGGQLDKGDLREMSALLDEALGKTSKIRESIRRAAQGEQPIKENIITEVKIKKPEPGQRAHILIIDDDPLMLRAIKEHLKDDYDVGTAVSGRVAMRFLENRTTDLILLDYEMPEEDGAAVLEKLRANRATRNIPVVFLTGIADTSKIKKILAYHPQGYLLKPINHDKLMKTISDIFYGKN